MEQPTAPKHISPRELASALGVTKPTVIHWLKRGWVEHTVLPNGRRLIHPNELDRLMATRGGDQCSPVVRDSFFEQRKAPAPANGNGGEDITPGEGVNVHQHSTSPATPSATAEERA